MTRMTRIRKSREALESMVVKPGIALLQFASLFLSVLSVSSVVPLSARAGEPTYWQDVRPILRKNCTACHNTRNLRQPEVCGGLALDIYEGVLKGPRQKVVEVGKSGDSLLIKLVTTTDPDPRMPVGDKPLAEETIAVLRQWIDSGAKEGQRPDA